jgi:hypothetical protein
MDDTWTSRDLPVLKAVVEIYHTTGKTVISPGEIAAKAGFDQETTERAIRALYRQPYLEPGHISWSGHTDAVGPPTGEALRVAGQWPTPENMLERLIAALEAAGDDETVAEPERSKLKQIALGVTRCRLPGHLFLWPTEARVTRMDPRPISRQEEEARQVQYITAASPATAGSRTYFDDSLAPAVQSA